MFVEPLAGLVNFVRCVRYVFTFLSSLRSGRRNKCVENELHFSHLRRFTRSHQVSLDTATPKLPNRLAIVLLTLRGIGVVSVSVLPSLLSASIVG